MEMLEAADPELLAATAVGIFLRDTASAMSERGSCTVALSGGSTPRAMFDLLARESYGEAPSWEQYELFWSDERAVPPEHPDSNYGMARDALLSKVPVPADHIHRMPAERTPLDRAAADYEAEIRHVVPAGEDGVPVFDLIMLGMGDDGHTASLFPDSPALDEHERLVVPNYVEKLDAHRMTFTPRLINAARSVLFLVAGAAKADTLAAVLQGPRHPRRYPSQLVAPERGTLYWLVDRAAAAKLQR
jgi:6-phosphogluconolactonase